MMPLMRMGKTIDGVFNHVPYQAKGMFSPSGGFKAGYRINKGDWIWGSDRIDDLESAVETACKMAREAIAMGEDNARNVAP